MYLGNDLQVAFPTYRNIDNISGSFNGVTTSFPLLVNGVAPVPQPLNESQCLISVNGVIQKPDPSGASGFRLSGGNIVFSAAPTGGQTFFGVILAGADYVNVGANFPSGTQSVPSITFDNDLDTGIYNSGANQISFTTSGTERLRIDSAGQIESVSLGSASSPAFSWTTDPNTGIYSPGADQLAFSTNGTGRVFINSSGQVGFNVSPIAEVDISGNYVQNIVAVAALDIDCSAGNYFTKTINGNSTFTVSNIPASRSYAFTLELTHTSGSITWFSGVEWPGGTAPTLTTGKTHLFMFVTNNGGSRWRASSLIDYTN
jgi:hypothetical protein